MEIQEMQGGVIAIRCAEQQDRGWTSTIPPLGTMNEDGKLTQENSTATCIAGTYKVSQAVAGRFERFFGKIGLSGGIDEESSDNNDVETGPDKVKGYEKITLSLNMTRENNKARLEGAIQGGWDYDAPAYYRHPSFRNYEVIIAFGPDVQSLDFASAECLHRYYGVKLERVENEFGNPNKFTISLASKRAAKFPNWTQPTPRDIVDDKTVAASTNYSADAQPQSPNVFQTRIKCVFTGHTTAGPLTIIGTNIFGEDVEESITLTGATPLTYITKNYFNRISTNGIQLGAGWAGATIKLDATEHDCKIVP